MSKSHGSDKLVDLSGVIPDTATLDATLSVLSRWICERHRPPGDTGPLARMLEQYGRTATPFEGGSSPAPLGAGFRSSQRPVQRGAALKRMDVRPDDVRRLWLRKKRSDGLHAKLPANWIAACVPVEFWPCVAAIISDGPQLAVARVEEVLLNYSERDAPRAQTKRAGAKYADNTLHLYGAVLSKLFGHLVEMRSAHAVLQSWTSVARLHVPAGTSQPMNTAAPPANLIRLAYARLEDAVLQAFRCENRTDLLRAIETAPDDWFSGSFRIVRLWAFLALLVCTGGRVGALVSARIEDFDPAYVMDSGVGPALSIRPGKGWRDDEVSVKPLGGAAFPLECWIAWLRRALGEAFTPALPLWPVGLTRPAVASSEYAAHGWLAGGGKSEAVIPFDTADPRRGYSPHRYRAAATKMLESLAAGDYLRENRVDIPQRFLADVLTDHSLKTMEAVYNQVRSPRGRAEVSGVAVQILWDLMTTDRGARKRPDVEGYRSALRRRRALEARDSQLDEDFAAAVEGARTSWEQAGPRLFMLMNDKAKIARELATLEMDIERIEQLDPRRFVSVPDDAPNTDLGVDLEAIRREVDLGQFGAPRGVRPRVRDWLTPEEFAAVIERSGKQVRKWMDGKSLPIRDCDRPWEAHRVPVEVLSRKRRRLLVDGLRPEFVHSDPVRSRRIEELLSDWPTKWSAKYRQTSAIKPRWMLESDATEVVSG